MQRCYRLPQGDDLTFIQDNDAMETTPVSAPTEWPGSRVLFALLMVAGAIYIAFFFWLMFHTVLSG
jgi:hypothetical protein